MMIEESDKLNICLLGAGFETGNMGVAALASGTIASIYYSFPGAKIFILDYNKVPANYTVFHPLGKSMVELVNIRFTKKVFLPNSILRLIVTALAAFLMPGENRKRHLLKRNPYLLKLNQASLVVSIAGGDSFSDIYGFSRLLYVVLPQLLVLLLRKPLLQLPQTYGPFNKALARLIAGLILIRSHRVYTRDRKGLAIVNEMTKGKIEKSTQFAFDMGFAVTPRAPAADIINMLAEMKKQGPLVGLNVSGLLYMGGYNRQNMFGLKTDYISTIHHIITYFMKREDVQLLLVPHVLGKGPKSEGDIAAIDKIFRELYLNYKKRIRKVDGTLDHHQLKYIIGKCDFFLGSRMHACIAAISQAVPTVGLSYSRKFKGVFESIDKEILIADLRSLDYDQIIDIVDHAFKHREVLHNKLKNRMPDIVQSVLDFFGRSNFATS
jgi:polysaccharide pyruvyl transferase WcaK-like protein